MCGIAGFWNRDDAPASESELASMLERIAHRGPDGRGCHREGALGLGHVRLSIIDVAEGQQPMLLQESGLSLVFNGEIFNFIELRKELESRGHRFRTHSDTEVILHSYEEWGEDCLQRFNGEWALALWNARCRTLFLARDRVGVRPLFYTWQPRRFAFASEIKSLFALPDVPRVPSPEGIADSFVFWHPLPPRTAFEGIAQLPPGHCLTLRAGGSHPVPRRWWHADFSERKSGAGDEDLVAELGHLLADATRLRLRADVPVGAYLSGGLDSSVTCGLASREANVRLRTFSVAFADAEFDESPFQNEVALQLGTGHDSLRCASSDIGRHFPQVVWHAEQPLLRTAPVPMYLLSRRVRELGFKVVLTGEGADEVLGGYDLFKEAKIRRFWGMEPDSSLRPLALRRLYPYLEGIRAQPLPYLKAFFHADPKALQNPLFSHMPRWELGMRNLLFFSEAFREALRDWSPIADLEAQLPPEFYDWTWLGRAQYLELAFLLPGYILCAQGDRMALAHGVEGRFPFLDPRVIAFGASLPDRLKIKGLNEKYILKKAASSLVPASVLRRPKQPYRSPDARSFTGPTLAEADFVAEVMGDKALREIGIFHPQAVSLLLRKARAGQIQSSKDNMAFTGVLSTQLLAGHLPSGHTSPL